jgi:hypothetical protein
MREELVNGRRKATIDYRAGKYKVILFLVDGDEDIDIAQGGLYPDRDKALAKATNWTENGRS